MVAYAINERMASRIEYLLEEVRVLRETYAETTGRKRIPFTDEQRRRLAVRGKALTPDKREACCQLERRQVRADPGAESGLHSARGAVRAGDPS